MKEILRASGTGICVALLSSATLAAKEDALDFTGKAPFFLFAIFAIIVVAAVYFRKSRDQRSTLLDDVFESRDPVHSVGPDTPVTECVRKMTTEGIGALIVMDGDELKGIFTERDALNKVLATGIDPSRTKVSEVMTKDPYCVPPTTTVGEAMELVTERRFRHLPVVEDGKVLAVVSSGDLTHWLVKNQVGEVRELVDLAARS
jgi:CBS domain-containing protein